MKRTNRSDGVSRRGVLALPAIAATLLGATGARAQQGQPLKIGLITSLSGPGGYLGQDIRDGFMLAVEMGGGKLGGAPVQVLVEDDALKPAQGKEIADRFYKSEGVRLFTGIVFSNVLGAVAPDVLDSGDAIYVSANAGPSNLAGRECHRNYYVVSWQNDQLHEGAGETAQRLGYKRMVLLAPNYQAGKDALTGFKRNYKGEVLREIYTRLDQTDFAAEMAQIRDQKPDAVFQFHPGGLGIAFARQYQQAGLLGQIPMTLASPSLDSTTVTAVGDAAIGLTVTSHWNSDFDNPANKRFVEAFQKKHSRIPTYYASQGYDTALAIGAALEGAGGSVRDTEAFRRAMLPAKFESVRGPFRFGPNQHPIQDWWALAVERGPDGKPGLRTKERVLKDHADAYASQCRL